MVASLWEGDHNKPPDYKAVDFLEQSAGSESANNLIRGIMYTVARLLCLGLVAFFVSPLVGQSEPGLVVPPGFEIKKFADDSLATNIYCITTNPAGQPVVSGPGYIKTLIDNDGDGVAERAQLFSALPRNGAQGLLVEGQHLYCVGDAGLLRFMDSDQDGQADGPPELLMPIRTGGEHDAHAIKRGPDGWLYLLAGNHVPAKPEYFNGRYSPVTHPKAGFLMRLSPDFRTTEIVAHGFRNAYDFDFNSDGQIFVYDSDGERDISLPWYQPTTVYQIRSGDRGGWVTASWKRPPYFFDMPITIGELGRGSPTGVCRIKNNGFPKSYDDAIFTGDWTFGRVAVFKRDPVSGRYDQGEIFAEATGQTAFAVTSLCNTPEGGLLVSVGGRGTKGAVFKITNSGKPNSRFANEDRAHRSIGKDKRKLQDFESVSKALVSDSVTDRLAALEMLAGKLNQDSSQVLRQNPRLVDGIAWCLEKADRDSLPLLMRVLEKISPDKLTTLDGDFPIVSQGLVELAKCRSGSTEWNAAQVQKTISFCIEHLGTVDEKQRLILIRIAQLALGGCGNIDGVPVVFHGYQAVAPKSVVESVSNALDVEISQKLIEVFPSLTARQKIEVARFAAMVEVGNARFADLLVSEMSKNSEAPIDIHGLICLARIRSPLSLDTQKRIANSLIGIREKIESQSRVIDRNWLPRMEAMARKLFTRSRIADWVIQHPEFGKDSHVFLFRALPRMLRTTAIYKFKSRIKSAPNDVTMRQLGVIAGDASDETMQLMRSFVDNAKLSGLAIRTLAKRALPADRNLFVLGLESRDRATVKQSVAALRKIGDPLDGREMVIAFKAIQRLSWDKADVAVRDELVVSIRKATQRNMGYQMKTASPQSEVLNRWSQFIATAFPKEFQEEFGGRNGATLSQRLSQVAWENGDIKRGAALYEKLQCAKCHDGGNALGPKLQGISKRFSRADVFRAIVAPSEHVPNRYRSVIIETVDGMIYTGVSVYDSVDGITILDANGEAVRINRDQIENRTTSHKSLMPEGLLDDVNNGLWADLQAYLENL